MLMEQVLGPFCEVCLDGLMPFQWQLKRNSQPDGWGIGGLWGVGTSHVRVDEHWWEGYQPSLSGTQLIKPLLTRNPISLLLLVLHLNGSKMEVDVGMLMRHKWRVMVGLW